MAVLSCCRAVGWRLSCYGRQVFSARVGQYIFLPFTSSSQFFLFEKCARTNSSRHTPSAPVEQRGCLER